MNLFARILSHGFALVVVALLAIALIYRGDLFPGMELPEFLALDRKQDTTDEPASTTDEPEAMPPAADVADAGADVTAVPSPDAPEADIGAGTVTREEAVLPGMDLTETMPVPDEMPVPGETADVTPAAESIPESAADYESTTTAADTGMPPAPVTAVAEEPVGEKPVTAPPAEPPVTAATETGTDMQAADTAAPEGQPVAGTDVEGAAPVAAPGEPGTAAVAPTEAAPEPAETTTATDADAAPAKSAYQLLAAAREAYWLRDYAVAEQNYRAMIDLDPGNPDGYGELGNMYFSQGKWDLASAAYFEAGKRLADEGQLEQARQLVDVLRGLQGPQAGELEQYVADKTSTNQ
ncbi:MAG: hypothetical protein R3308_06560 [Thiohalobacterales bacterium]|nr:hypothetical protein [Thiohalobacterales bacterium]